MIHSGKLAALLALTLFRLRNTSYYLLLMVCAESSVMLLRERREESLR